MVSSSQLRRFPRPEGLPLSPEVLHELCDVGVPEPFLSFEPTAHLQYLDENPSLLIFGTLSRPVGGDLDQHQLFCCLSLPDGHVLDCQRGRDPLVVNASLSLFRETARAVMSRFPLPLDLDSPEGADKKVADELESLIASVDPIALSEAGFWFEFLWDVRIGDYRDGI
jgi:hypothetical protein